MKKNTVSQTLASKSRKIRSVEELDNLEDRGILVVCPEINYMETPRKIDTIIGLSYRSIRTMIRKGLYAVGETEEAPEGSLLESAKIKIRSTGLSNDEIAKMVGVTKQSVSQLMNAKSVQTKTLDKYLNALGIFK